MTFVNRVAASIVTSVTLAIVLTWAMHAAPAGIVHYPDLHAVIPLTDFSIIQPTPSTRELRYTHITSNLGDGPLEIRPEYDPTTDTSIGFQRFYSHDASTDWTLVDEKPIVGRFVFHAPHGHYHFPLSQFGLFAVAADGSIGSSVIASQKIGFCIADSLQVQSIPHAGTFGYSGSGCADPASTRGISVGYGDLYDFNDDGQSIDISALSDGDYWFRAADDPFNYLIEKDETNNFTDVKLRIAGSTVTVLAGPVHPSSQPPTVAMTAPSAGAVSGSSVTLSADATDASGITEVQFLVDGSPVGATLTAQPFSIAWDSTTVANGTHYLSAQALAGSGFYGTATPVAVTVSNGVPTPVPGAFGVDTAVSANGVGGALSTTLTTSGPDTLLIAFAASDGPLPGTQTLTVTTSGLSWTLVRRANGAGGTAEIWKATAASTLTNAVVTATQAAGGYHQSLTVIAFIGAAGTGASASDSATTGAPTISLTTTAAGSRVYGVGHDWSLAIPRTLGPNQTMVHQWVDTSVGDTFWVQTLTDPVPNSGTVATLNDTSPTTDRWNFSAVEVVPASGISNVIATNRTASSATITWTTNTPATSQVDYGLDTNYGTTVTDSALVTSHSVDLTGLNSSTTYHYRLTSVGAAGTATAGDFIFITAGVSELSCEITGPAIGATVSGITTVTAHAVGTASIEGVQFKLDGANLGAEVLRPLPDVSIDWDTSTATNGNHMLTCVARDPTGNTATSGPAVVTVSNAPQTVDVPNVVGMTQSAATTAITNVGLVVGTVTTESSTTVPSGLVISEDPSAGTPAALGSAVSLVVSSGPPPVPVPDVVGLTQDAASTAITDVGLTVGTVTTQSSTTVPFGLVLSQDPSAGTPVAPGSAVKFVVSSGPPPPSPVTVDKVVFSDGNGRQRTPAFSLAAAGEVLIAFVATDGPASGTQRVTVAGAGLTWTLVKRANAQAGSAEIWKATVTSKLTNITVTSTQAVGGFHQSLTVVAFKGATGTGASNTASAPTGAPAVSLTATKPGALVYAVGNDWDRAVARTLGPDQVMIHQWVDTSVGDTFWVEASSFSVASASSVIQLNATAPTNDRWNFAIVEIVP